MIRILFALIISLPLIHCTHMGSGKHDHGGFNKGRFAPGGVDYVEYHGIYFTGQPSEEDLQAAKEQGIEVVINLRTRPEIKALSLNEKKVAKNLGLTYYNFPVDARKKINGKTMAKIEKAMMTHHPKQKVMIHCGSGQRAASWFAHHVFSHHKDNKEKALHMAEQAGLTSPALRSKVSDHLDTIK